MFFSSAFGNRFFGDFFCFFRIRTLIFVRTASVLEHFHKIDGFLKSSKKTWILGSVFGGRNGKKSRKNGAEKHAFFRHQFFGVFLRFLAILLGFWEAWGLQKIEKNWKNRKKSIFQRVQF